MKTSPVWQVLTLPLALVFSENNQKRKMKKAKKKKRERLPKSKKKVERESDPSSADIAPSKKTKDDWPIQSMVISLSKPSGRRRASWQFAGEYPVELYTDYWIFISPEKGSKK